MLVSGAVSESEAPPVRRPPVRGPVTRANGTGSVPAHGEHRLEAAEDQAAGVERRLAGSVHPRVLVHLGLGVVEALLVRPDLPGEDNLLARLGRHRAAEVGLLA